MQVSVPTDKPEFLRQAFSVLASWCCKIRWAALLLPQLAPYRCRLRHLIGPCMPCKPMLTWLCMLGRCAQEDVDKERGAVLEEWRGTKDSMGRTQEATYKFLLAGCKVGCRACVSAVLGHRCSHAPAVHLQIAC